MKNLKCNAVTKIEVNFIVKMLNSTLLITLPYCQYTTYIYIIGGFKPDGILFNIITSLAINSAHLQILSKVHNSPNAIRLVEEDNASGCLMTRDSRKQYDAIRITAIRVSQEL